MAIFLTFGLFDNKKIREGGAQKAVLPTLLTHPKPFSKHKIDGLRIFWKLFCKKKGRNVHKQAIIRRIMGLQLFLYYISNSDKKFKIKIKIF
jgi:hypothetical protein